MKKTPERRAFELWYPLVNEIHEFLTEGEPLDEDGVFYAGDHGTAKDLLKKWKEFLAEHKANSQKIHRITDELDELRDSWAVMESKAEENRRKERIHSEVDKLIRTDACD